jgi:hypothetical protein
MRLAFVIILGASIERPLVFWVAAAWRAAHTIELHKTQTLARPALFDVAARFTAFIFDLFNNCDWLSLDPPRAHEIIRCEIPFSIQRRTKYFCKPLCRRGRTSFK